MLRFEDELAKIMIPSSNTACFEDELRDNEKEGADSKVSRPLFCEGCEVSGGLRFAPAPPNVSCVPA